MGEIRTRTVYPARWHFSIAAIRASIDGVPFSICSATLADDSDQLTIVFPLCGSSSRWSTLSDLVYSNR